MRLKPSNSSPAQQRSQRIFFVLIVIAMAFLSTEWTWLKVSDPRRQQTVSETSGANETMYRSQSLTQSYSSWMASSPAPTESSYLTQEPLHILFGLSGNHPGFFAEVEVALKAVLLHAPLDRNMTIHVMADDLAFLVFTKT